MVKVSRGSFIAVVLAHAPLGPSRPPLGDDAHGRGHQALLPIGHPGRAELGREDRLDELGLRLAADSRRVEPPGEQRRKGGALQPTVRDTAV